MVHWNETICVVQANTIGQENRGSLYLAQSILTEDISLLIYAYIHTSVHLLYMSVQYKCSHL